MAMQFLPILKAVAPYIAQIAAATIPTFSSKSNTNQSDLALARQIEELQSAATQHAQSIHVLAEKMQQTIEGIEAAAQEARQQVSAYKTMLYLALGLSLLACSACAYLLVR